MFSWKRLERSATVLRLRSKVLYSNLLQTLVRCNRPLFENASALEGFIASGDWQSLMEWADSVSPQKYGDPAQYFAASQLAALVLKYPFTPDELPGLDPDGRALSKFHAAEVRCGRINQRFKAIRLGGRPDPYPEVTREVRAWFLRVLGHKPDFAKIHDECDYGPGASLGVHGNATNIGRKLLSEKWSVTPTALPYALHALWANAHVRELILREEGHAQYCVDPVRFSELVRARCVLVDHNKITFVPKTAKSSRTIAIEPLLNGFLQKGVDKFMRARLLKRTRVNLDLRDQPRNSAMALEGSRMGVNPYCTIDLSSASDSMSTEVVRHVLPFEWFDFLSQIRSPAYELGGEVTSYQKFVSMGNGFCFPLETALFAALTHAVSVVYGNPIDYRVYGDDIICRQGIGLVVLELLKYYGFRPNPSKTFLFGPFRESCGGDWYEGLDVRPVYLDERLESIQSLFILHNSSLGGSFKESFWEEGRSLLREAMPRDVRFMRPYPGNPDSAFTVPHDIFMGCSHAHWSRHEQRWRHREMVSSAVADTFCHNDRKLVEYIAVLRGSSSSTPLALRRMTRTRVVWK